MKLAPRRAEWPPTSSYFLVGATPWCANSRSARSLAPTCSPIASRRMRSWQDWQILPFGTAIGLPQTMHFLVGSDIAGSVSQINKLPIDLVDDLDLFGTLHHDLQAVLRMIFNGSDYFHVLVFEILWRLLVLLEKLDG